MSVRNLDALFQPRSVAVIGASNREGSVGNVVMGNLLTGGFNGPIMPVNPKYQAVRGVLTVPDVASLPSTPDLAVICTPPSIIPDIISTLGARGTRAAIVLTAGLGDPESSHGETIAAELLHAARPNLLRILGPNCVGLLVPKIGLNASFAPDGLTAGNIAFASQSGALCTAVLDWARARSIGFSHFISLGDAADIDFGDLLDYLASDAETRAILLYVEAVKHARKFMSAARAAARNKPVIVIKAGRSAAGADAAASHTGALAGADDVYDAAIRRAGMLRVFSIQELFEAVETLAHARPMKGDRLLILSNGGGPGVLATDALVERGGRLAEISDDTLSRLDAVLPSTWSRANPIDIIGDASSERYAAALNVLKDDRNHDATLVMHAPTAIASPRDVADAVIDANHGAKRNMLTCWLGRDGVTDSRQRFGSAHIPTYDTPDSAIRAFLHMVDYRRNQDALMQTPASTPIEFTPDREQAESVIRSALDGGRPMLGAPEAKEVLSAYGIPVVDTHIAATSAEAAVRAEELGYPVALKILSPDISHKTDVGGVVLELNNAQSVALAAEGMLARIRELQPEAQIDGFAVERMARVPGAFELIIGASVDPTFGPILLFGEGGTAVELVADRAIALPPLNMTLAEDLIERTRVSRLLGGHRGLPGIDLQALRLALIRVSQLVIDVPEIVELDINPLLAWPRGILALDSRIRVGATQLSGEDRLAIRPYPESLEETLSLSDGRKVLLRPIRPEDEPAHQAFFEKLSSDDIRFRFFGLVSSLPHTEMARYTQIDYDREMAFIATTAPDEATPQTLGVVRSVTDPDNIQTEFAIIIRSDLKGHGLGRRLLEKMIDYCRRRGTRTMVGQVLRDNRAMLGLAKALGFTSEHKIRDEAVTVALDLQIDARTR